MEGRRPCLPQFRRMRILRHLLIHIFCAVVCIAGATPLAAQMLPSLPKASPGSFFGERQDGLFLTAPLTVDGAPVFRMAAPVTPPDGELPIDVRMLFVHNAVAQSLAQKESGGTAYDPSTLKVDVEVVAKEQTLVATDGKHADEIPILTVTSADAQYAKLPVDILAKQWQPLLQTALVAALERRQPAVIKQNYDSLARVGGVVILATLLALISWIVLNRRRAALKRMLAERKDRVETAGAESQATTAPERRRFLALALRAAGPEEELQRLQTLSASLGWIVALVWAGAITWALLLFAQTAALGQLIAHTAANVAFIWIVAAVVNTIGDLVIARFARAYSHRGFSGEEHARHVLRAPTISHSLGGFKRFVIVFAASLATLSALSIPIASVVTIGGVLALAIGFAAQSLVRDFLNGLLVLFEDQYVVGDYVMIGEYNGIVENLSLRVVQIRDGRGYLVTIPHSAVSQVVNASRNWSRIDFRIPIDAGSDLAKAVSTLRLTLEGFTSDPAWKEAILKPVEWIGLEDPSKNGIVLRAAIRSAPLRQFELSRAINQRVFEAFAREGITLGIDPMGVPVPAVTASPSPL